MTLSQHWADHFTQGEKVSSSYDSHWVESYTKQGHPSMNFS